jgi:hypothetical protein
MTAFVASFGFIPMALSTPTGAEIRRSFDLYDVHAVLTVGLYEWIEKSPAAEDACSSNGISFERSAWRPVDDDLERTKRAGS